MIALDAAMASAALSGDADRLASISAARIQILFVEETHPGLAIR